MANLEPLERRTEVGFTATAIGSVPHFPWNGLLLPVCIQRLPKGVKYVAKTSRGLPYPVREGGHYVYALPGGGTIVR